MSQPSHTRVAWRKSRRRRGSSRPPPTSSPRSPSSDSVRPRDEARTTRAAPRRAPRAPMPERPSVQTARRVNNHHPSPSDANAPLPTQSDTVKRALGSDLGDYGREDHPGGPRVTSIVPGVEFAGMFSGVSLFSTRRTCLHSHFFGAVFVGLFVCLEELSSFRWLFTSSRCSQRCPRLSSGPRPADEHPAVQVEMNSTRGRAGGDCRERHGGSTGISLTGRVGWERLARCAI